MPEKNIVNQFDSIDERLDSLEHVYSAGNDNPFDHLLAEASGICKALLELFASAHGKVLPDSDDLLVLFKAFVKGDASLTAIRDNVRELVYYRNCINEERYDVLPKNPEKMTLHTVRHIYFYLRSRADQEALLG